MKASGEPTPTSREANESFRRTNPHEPRSERKLPGNQPSRAKFIAVFIFSRVSLYFSAFVTAAYWRFPLTPYGTSPDATFCSAQENLTPFSWHFRNIVEKLFNFISKTPLCRKSDVRLQKHDKLDLQWSLQTKFEAKLSFRTLPFFSRPVAATFHDLSRLFPLVNPLQLFQVRFSLY